MSSEEEKIQKDLLNWAAGEEKEMNGGNTRGKGGNSMEHIHFENDEMFEYFMSLPQNVQKYIVQSGAEISTLGELMQIGEHFKREI